MSQFARTNFSEKMFALSISNRIVGLIAKKYSNNNKTVY